MKQILTDERNSFNSPIPLEEIIRTSDIIFNNTYFSFQNSIYKQIFGLPMGSPLAPVCADLVMNKLVSTCLEKLNFHIPFFYKFVDDIITCIPKNKINDIVDCFNSYHSRPKFTYEIENNNCIPF